MSQIGALRLPRYLCTLGLMDAEAAALVRDFLAEIRRSRQALDRAEFLAVHFARYYGATWEDIGEALGMSRQAAQRRFGVLRKRHR